jgi:hypothetical protein
VLQVAVRLHVSVDDVLDYNAARFYAVVEVLENAAREQEGIVKEEEERWRRRRGRSYTR